MDRDPKNTRHVPSLDGRHHAREALMRAISREGVQVLSDPKRLAQLVDDELAGLPRERTLLVRAVEIQVPAIINGVAKQSGSERAIELAAASLFAIHGRDPDGCLWVAAEIAQLLGHPPGNHLSIKEWTGQETVIEERADPLRPAPYRTVRPDRGPTPAPGAVPGARPLPARAVPPARPNAGAPAKPLASPPRRQPATLPDPAAPRAAGPSFPPTAPTAPPAPLPGVLPDPFLPRAAVAAAAASMELATGIEAPGEPAGSGSREREPIRRQPASRQRRRPEDSNAQREDPGSDGAPPSTPAPPSAAPVPQEPGETPEVPAAASPRPSWRTRALSRAAEADAAAAASTEAEPVQLPAFRERGRQRVARGGIEEVPQQARDQRGPEGEGVQAEPFLRPPGDAPVSTPDEGEPFLRPAVRTPSERRLPLPLNGVAELTEAVSRDETVQLDEALPLHEAPPLHGAPQEATALEPEPFLRPAGRATPALAPPAKEGAALRPPLLDWGPRAAAPMETELDRQGPEAEPFLRPARNEGPRKGPAGAEALLRTRESGPNESSPDELSPPEAATKKPAHNPYFPRGPQGVNEPLDNPYFPRSENGPANNPYFPWSGPDPRPEPPAGRPARSSVSTYPAPPEVVEDYDDYLPYPKARRRLLRPTSIVAALASLAVIYFAVAGIFLLWPYSKAQQSPAPQQVATNQGSAASEQALLAHIPPAIQPLCQQPASIANAQVVASLTCVVTATTGDSIGVVYDQFVDIESAKGSFKTDLTVGKQDWGPQTALANASSCDPSVDPSFNGKTTYTRPSSATTPDSGQLSCWISAVQEPTVDWTSATLAIDANAAILRPAGSAPPTAVDEETLYRFWLQAGPQ